MALRAKVWLQKTDEYTLPVDPFAIVELVNRYDWEAYVPKRVNVVPGVEYKFRLGQIEKRYELIRSIPRIVVCALEFWPIEADYRPLEILPETRTWKAMVDWPEVIKEIEKKCREKYWTKIAGYSGPESPC